MGLKDVFGNKPVFRVLDFLLVHRDLDYSLSEIEGATEVSYRSLQSIVPSLVKRGLAVETRKVGKAKMYELNKKSNVAKKLDELAIAASFEAAGRQKLAQLA
ncbi:TPA: hypothetical protein HA244_04985 [Candidatus Micrarchaeota archaeon]|nr:hypothetical protein [Candidatus Micrarchaeota archaeon]